MGRKSTKGKEKKLKRKEEVAKINASQAAVDAANQVENPFKPFVAFQKYRRNGLDLDISCKKVTEMKADEVQWAFDLTKTNMETLYQESEWGWNDKNKFEEMTEDTARYLIVTDSEGKGVALSHFRFDLDENMDEVIYCYEIQVDSSYHHKGLGKFLMQILELMGHKAQMKKIVLTVFTDNKVAVSFFKNCLNYLVDDTSPHLWDPTEEYSYEILSKPLIKKGQTPAESCCPSVPKVPNLKAFVEPCCSRKCCS